MSTISLDEVKMHAAESAERAKAERNRLYSKLKGLPTTREEDDAEAERLEKGTAAMQRFLKFLDSLGSRAPRGGVFVLPSGRRQKFGTKNGTRHRSLERRPGRKWS